MDADEVYRSVMEALRRANLQRDKSDREVAALKSRVEQLVELLAAKAVINDGHRRLFDKVAERVARDGKPTVRLRQLVDKYQIPDAGIDCEARLPLCHGRCCAFTFELTTQDLDEGGIRWELDEPYVIRHEADNYCTHLDRPSLGCTIYEKRPATCRSFDCRGDARVWLDFEARIPAPMPDGLVRPQAASPK